MDWNNIKKVYMIGIKGVGMTMLAQYLSGLSIEVSGSDVPEVFLTDEVLAKAGIKVFSGFKVEQIPAADLIIYSSAYNESNPELAFARKENLKLLSYAEAMAKVFNYKNGIAVCGSHGKTTTTAWLGFVMNSLNMKPSVMVGSRVPQFEGSAIIGESDYLIIEADEYQNKLALFEPKAVVINNIDYDHPDFYKTEADYIQAFASFLEKVPAKGFVVANFDDKYILSLQAKIQAKIISYGIDNQNAELIASELAVKEGKQFFKASLNGEDLGYFNTQLIGKHNVYNALAVIATSLEFGGELLAIREALAEFSGTARRMEYRGEFNGAKIYDDYAHHPTEVKASIAAIKQMFPDKKLTVVFHPHTFTRTKALFNDFASSFSLVDKLMVLEIYGSAREEQGGVSSEDLVVAIKKENNNLAIEYCANLEEAEKKLRIEAKSEDVVLLLGAGDVFRIADNLIPVSLRIPM